MALDPYDAPDPKRLLDQEPKPEPLPVIPEVPDPGMVEVDTPHRGDDVSLVPLGAEDYDDGDDDVGEVELADPIDTPEPGLSSSAALPAPVPVHSDVVPADPPPARPSEPADVIGDVYEGFDDLDPAPTNSNLQLGIGLALAGAFVMLGALCLFGVPALLRGIDAGADAAVDVPAPRAGPAVLEPPADPAPFAIEPEQAPEPVEPAVEPAPVEPVEEPPVEPVEPVEEPPVVEPAPKPVPPRPKPRPRPRPRPRPTPAPAPSPAPSPAPVAPAPAPVPQPPSGSPWDTPQ